MSDSNQTQRQVQVRLVVRDEKDDPSILDIVRVAIDDGLRAPVAGTAAPQEPAEDPQERLGTSQLDDVATRAREIVEEALEKVIERFRATGQEPKFDPAQWVERLSNVWAAIHEAKTAGVQLRVVSVERAPPPAEAP